ncbi:hypothetical protein [Aquimarina sp. AU474]|uniref:hypothetical protein n=1 Tax=Aquimarina sp. AU474 TaxID=2108529 RepID=UPI000D697F2F|nr:hypothetical protein [Aquimarina sp. AU474]
MLKSILKLQGVKQISKKEKNTILAGCGPRPIGSLKTGTCYNLDGIWTTTSCHVKCEDGTTPTGCKA